jgi:flagellar biosynthesis protein FliR
MQTFVFGEEWLLRIFLVWVRISCIFLSAPFFSHPLNPLPMRIMLSLAISYCLSGIVPVDTTGALVGGAPMLIAILKEAAIGIILGFVAQLVFAGIQVAGQVVGTQAGFSLVNIIDPQTSVENSLLSVYLNSLGLILFISFNGHHILIRALARSFTLTPQASGLADRSLWLSISRQAGDLFVIGLQIVAPLFAVMLILEILISLAAKMAPQVPILILSFPVKLLVGMMGLSLCLYQFPHVMERYFIGHMGWLEKLLTSP